MATNPLPRRPPPSPDSPAGGPRQLPPEPAPPGHALATRQPSPLVQRKQWLRAGLGVGGLGLAALLVVGLPGEEVRVPDRPYTPPGRSEHTQSLREAKNLIRDGKWVEARARLLELQQRAPHMDIVADYLKRAEVEIPNQQHMEEARAALSAGQLTRAKVQLDAVSPDTMQFEQANMLRRQLRDTADLRAREAVALYGKGQYQEARAIAEDVLGAFPEHGNARTVLSGRENPRTPSPPPEPALPLTHFMSGDLPRAVELAQACASTSRSCNTEFKALIAFSGLSSKEPGKLGPKDLPRLMALDQKLAGPQSPSPLAQKFIAAARSKAKETYLMGYALKEAEPRQALVKFREAVALTLPDDEVHQKAKHWIDTLGR